MVSPRGLARLSYYDAPDDFVSVSSNMVCTFIGDILTARLALGLKIWGGGASRNVGS